MNLHSKYKTADVETLVVLVTLGHAGAAFAGDLLAKK